MEKLYSTGEFAKMAGVTLRTIRYYDKIGLLKPAKILKNGYRRYCNQDLITLQRILSLKELGFSLEEIYPLIQDNDQDSFLRSIQMQTNLIDQKIKHLTNLKDSLKATERLISKNNIAWDKIIELIKLSSIDESIVNHYMNAKNLEARIKLHDLFSTNQEGWFPWLFKQIDFSTVYKLLEIGCGNGKLWENNHYSLRNREIFLSDNSEGMVNELKNKLGNVYNYLVIDCQNIPFKNNYFDTIIANHVLFYLKDLNQGLLEISRVLKSRGTFYCTTYSKKHLQEITQLVKNFDSRINLSSEPLPDYFGLENGKEILSHYFNFVELKKYHDSLLITKSQPLIDYILSCHGNQNDYLANRIKEFKQYIDNLIKESNGIHITKDSGLFICTK
ncbi:MAG: MerR family transcriptional regulator [Thomasclavelia sp.]